MIGNSLPQTAWWRGLLECESYEEFVTVNTSAYNAVFERFIRQYPDAWLWVHNRFKDTQEQPGLWIKRRG